MEHKSKSLLSARKQAEISKAEEMVIQAGVQYNLGYEKYNTFRVLIDNEEKRAAIIFILDEMIEKAELNFQMSPIIEQLGDPATKEALNYREFKLLQEVIKNVRITGRDNHIKMSKSMKAFNEAGEYLNKMEEENKIFISEYQKASQYYGKLCNQYGILPENLDAQIDGATEKAISAAQEDKGTEQPAEQPAE